MAKLKIFVASAVYGYEELLYSVYRLLAESFEYEVWMSHTGTIPVGPHQTAFDSCLAAVRECDLFFGIITPFYGSGLEEAGGMSITHREMLLAIELNKPRWFVVHDHVVFARSLLAALGSPDAESRANNLNLGKNRVFGDLRVIDMYEAAARKNVKTYEEATGNWVQKFTRPEEALGYATAQFSRYRDVENFVHEQFAKPKQVANAIARRQNDGNE